MVWLISAGPLILTVVNKILPNHLQLGSDITGKEIAEIVRTLPRKNKEELKSQKMDFDTTVKRFYALKTMMVSEVKSKHTA